MNKFSIFNSQFLRSCLKSMRLRTLPLSLAGVMLGAFIAATHQSLSPLTVVLLFLTTALLQVLSNLSNELGDTLHGTDTDQRLGIHYSLQDGDRVLRPQRVGYDMGIVRLTFRVGTGHTRVAWCCRNGRRHALHPGT